MVFPNPVRYVPPVTYTRSTMSHFLDQEVWGQILKADSVALLLQILEKTHYGTSRVLSAVDPSDLRAVEREIFAYWAEEARAPMVFLSGKQRQLLEWQWRLFEVDNLKILLRGLDQSVPAEEIKNSLVPLPPESRIDWTGMAEIRSIPELIHQLSGTPYGRMLKIALDRYQEEGHRFVLEIALDLGYNRALMKSVQDLGGSDRLDAERYLGNVIDSRLIIWSYRFRIFAGMEPEQIINYTLERGFRVRFRDIKAIATGADPETVLREIYGRDLADKVRGIPVEDAVRELEIIFLRLRLDEAQKDRLRPPFYLGPLLAYEAQLESEALDLITVMESVEAGLPEDEIRSHLILKQGEYV